MRVVRLIASALMLVADSAAAQLAPPVPQRAAGELVIATSVALAPQVRRAAARISGRVRVAAVGSDVAMAWLYTAQADAAVIGRDALDNEVKAYAWIHGHPPVASAIGPGSVATSGHSPALAVLLNRSNPIRSVTLDVLREAFRTGSAAPTWRALGATGRLADRPIHLVIPDAESGTGRFLRHALLADQVQLEWSRVLEVAGADDAAPDRVIDAAVARDPLALGFGTALRRGRARAVQIDGRAPGDAGYLLARQILLYAPASPAGSLARFADALKAVR